MVLKRIFLILILPICIYAQWTDPRPRSVQLWHMAEGVIDSLTVSAFYADTLEAKETTLSEDVGGLIRINGFTSSSNYGAGLFLITNTSYTPDGANVIDLNSGSNQLVRITEPIVEDTLKLKNLPPLWQTVNLKQLSSSNTNGGGMFVYTDSAADKPVNGVTRFASATAGKHWESLSWKQRKVITPEMAGARRDSTTNDSAAFVKMLNVLYTEKGQIELQPGFYNIGQGIVDSVQGLTVIGLGHRGGFDPNNRNLHSGAVLVVDSDCVGWTHQNNTGGSSNDYQGPRFENLTFTTTLGSGGKGLLIKSNYSRVVNCMAKYFSGATGEGFRWDLDSSYAVANDASWHWIESNVAIDCMTGFNVGGDGGGSGSQVFGNITLKTTGGGIKFQGTGMLITSGNVTVVGGKDENNRYGTRVTAFSGVTITARRFESNNIALSLDRPSDPGYASRIKLIGNVTSGISGDTAIVIGQYQEFDEIIGTSGSASGIFDSGSGSVILTSRMADERAGLALHGTQLGSLSPTNTTSGYLLWDDLIEMQIRRSDASGATNSPRLRGQRDRNGSLTNNADLLLGLYGDYFDGSANYISTAKILLEGLGSGTPSSSSYPTRIRFQTSPTGSNTPATVLELKNSTSVLSSSFQLKNGLILDSLQYKASGDSLQIYINGVGWKAFKLTNSAGN